MLRQKGRDTAKGVEEIYGLTTKRAATTATGRAA